MRGIENPQVAAEVHRLSLYPGGKWFSEAGVQELPDAAAAPSATPGKTARRPAVQVVLGEGIARELGRSRNAAQLASARNPNRLDVGDTFDLDERTWLVVGVMQSAGSTFDSEVWAKGGMIGPMFGKETYTSVVLRAEDVATARKLKDYFTNRYKTAAIQAQVETDYFAALSGSNQQFLYGVAVVAVIMAAGGMFGVMNTMFAAISQRTKDIGVLRLLGYNRRAVLISFLLESLLIALVGGGLGFALGWLVDGWSATSVVSNGPGGGKFVVLRLVVDGQIVAAGLLLTLVMGILGGIVPGDLGRAAEAARGAAVGRGRDLGIWGFRDLGTGRKPPDCVRGARVRSEHHLPRPPGTRRAGLAPVGMAAAYHVTRYVQESAPCRRHGAESSCCTETATESSGLNRAAMASMMPRSNAQG